MDESLTVEVIAVGEYLTNCFLVGYNNEGFIIDPGDEPQKIEKILDKHEFQIRKIILTHGHIDHIKAVPHIKEITKAPVLIHPDDAEMLTDAKVNLSAFHDISFTAESADEFLREGDIIELDKFQFRVLHTPGHTPGGISLLTDGIVFTGDALFWGSVGRSDFPGGNHQTLINSIKTKLLTLPDNTIVYPGHGPETSIGNERKINPFLI